MIADCGQFGLTIQNGELAAITGREFPNGQPGSRGSLHDRSLSGAAWGRRPYSVM